MKKYLTAILIYLLLSFEFTLNVLSQTAGAGDVLSIESLAGQLEDNLKQITNLNNQIVQSHSDEFQRLTQLKKELELLQNEKASALNDLRNGFFCSQCNRSKTEIERTGESFQHHLADVHGVAVPAKPELIKQKTDEYDKKIADKTEEIRKFQNEENEFGRKRNELQKQIDTLLQENRDLCNKMGNICASYKNTVLAQAKRIQSEWAYDLMQTLAEKHVYEDKINIVTVKLSDLQQEFIEASKKLKEKVDKQNEVEKDKRKNKITENNNLKIQLTDTFNARQFKLKSQKTDLETRLEKLKSKKRNNKKLTPDEQVQLDKDIGDLESKVNAREEAIKDNLKDYQYKTDKLQKENLKLQDEITQLTINLPKLQDEAVLNLKAGFDIKQKILNDPKAAMTEKLVNKGNEFVEKEEKYNQKQRLYYDEINKERNRIANAFQRGGCSSYNTIDVITEANAQWNNMTACIASLDKRSNTYYGCTDQAPIYQQHYNSLMAGLSADEVSALKRSTARTHFDLILKKIP